MKVKHIVFQIVAINLLLVFFCGCKSVSELKNLQKCDFEFVNVSDFEYAGVKFSNIQLLNDIGAENVTRIIAAATSKTAKASFNINVKVSNQAASRASVDGMKWALFLDDEQLLEGDLPQPFAVEPQSSAVMALRANIIPSVRGKAAPLQQIFRLYQNIMGFGDGEQSNLTLKIKPIVNKTELPYITLKLK
ncbi:MAG: hypothetical protein FWH36_07390 [Lentimicrobiaceae bacterium]|nr:hypothetical protein [Lentimicrobiaceae bacterium]